MEEFLLQLFIFFISASIAVPIAKKFALGSVLGYLIAGVCIGPFGLSLIDNIEEIMHITEFGVVMMLFLIGLELKPSLLWELKTPIFATGSVQVLLSTFFIFFAGLYFVSWQEALAIGLIFSLSSTAIVLQTLKEKNLTNTKAGKSIFSVLLFQDLAVIPILAILPLLATFELSNSQLLEESVLFNIHSLPDYLQVIVTIASIALILILGKYATRPVLKIIAQTKVREIFVAASLALIVGISLLMNIVGLSPALGTFLAGVVLANSEYRHELESDIQPFKGLLLGVFFISVGASLNFLVISKHLLLVITIVVLLILLKFLAIYITARVFSFEKKSRVLFALYLAQGSEFAFVLLQFSKANGILKDTLIDPLTSSVAISMFLAPIIFIIYDKIFNKPKEQKENLKEEDEIIYENNKVIIAGFGRLGTDLGRFLISSNIKPIIIDNDSSNVEILREFGFEVFYGDVTRLDLLKSAGASQAKLLIITISDIEKSIKIIKLVKKHFPNLEIAVNAHTRKEVYALIDSGVKNIRLETFASAINLGKDALEILGVDAYEVNRLANLFVQKDKEMYPILNEIYKKDKQKYKSMYQKHNQNLKEIMMYDKNNSLNS